MLLLVIRVRVIRERAMTTDLGSRVIPAGCVVVQGRIVISVVHIDGRTERNDVQLGQRPKMWFVAFALGAQIRHDVRRVDTAVHEIVRMQEMHGLQQLSAERSDYGHRIMFAVFAWVLCAPITEGCAARHGYYHTVSDFENELERDDVALWRVDAFQMLKHCNMVPVTQTFQHNFTVW